MAVTKDEVRYIASLAKLYFSEEELAAMTSEMDSLVDFANTLSALDTGGLPPMAHVQPLANVFRSDGAHQDFPTEKALANAPESAENCFVVPKVVE